MKRKILLLIFLGAFSSTFAQEGTMPDWANKKGAFGIGANTSLTSYSTKAGNSNTSNSSTLGLLVHARYGITPIFIGQIGLGFNQSATINEFDNWETKWKTSGLVANVAVQGNIIPPCSKDLNLGVVFGVDIFNGTGTYEATGFKDQTEDVSQLLFTLGLRPEYHFSNFFNIQSEVGIFFDLDVISVGNTTIDGNDESSIELFGTGNTFGQFGFTVWFN